MKTKLNRVEIRFFNQHPSGVRPGWMPRWTRMKMICPFETQSFFAINWRDKELIIEWMTVKIRDNNPDKVSRN